MDPEKEKRQQTLKVLFAETLMVLTAITLVVVLVLIVSGYWIDENFEVARSGMLQVSSSPTGATVKIDEDVLSQRTNTSRVIPTGTHVVTLQKDGYDSWSKEISIKEGLLYQLRYPRLFLEEREVEKTPLDFVATKASISPKRDQMLLMNTTSKWALINLDDTRGELKSLDLTKLLPSGYAGEILSAEWSRDEKRILIGMRFEPDKTSWLLIDLTDILRSVDLSSEFGVGFSRVVFANDSGDSLLALRNQNLQQINLNNKSISAILVEKVSQYYQYGDNVIFVAEDEADQGYVGRIRLNKSDVETMLKLDNLNAKAFFGKFYDNEYLMVVSGNKASVYLKDDYEKAVYTYELSFEPSVAKLGGFGEYLLMNNDIKMATLDMESETLREWEIESPNFGWLDDNMIYIVNNNELIVYDFDGLNRRTIAQNVSGSFPATITSDKWLYYISDNNLVREWLVRK